MIRIDPQGFPRPADPDRAKLGMERLLETAGAGSDHAAARRLAGNPTARTLLSAVFGNSAYLTQSILRFPDIVASLLEDGPDAVFERIVATLRADCGAETSPEKLMRPLRQAKGRAALVVALADIAGLWPMEKVTRALSDLADAALQLSARCLLKQLAADGAFELPPGDEPEADSGLVLLALGKLGAQELNYSSDIDLMILYEPEKIRCADPAALPQAFVRLARMLLRVMDERTADGYVFRTDLRLRPDPGATPLAIPIAAAETYYESVGQNWERAAMIRARAAAGDIGVGETFLQHLRPFVWRKHLDFAAVQDIHSIKRQITAYRGGAQIAIDGHDIKLGRGGIREIEFFAQTQQLIWGGRYPTLRTQQVCETLKALADHGRMEHGTAERMADSYRYLRRLEHRLQMVDDRQTHALPKSAEQIDAIAAFMGYPDGAAFREDLLRHLSRVEAHYAELFEEAPDLGGDGTLVFTGAKNHPETVATLERKGFADGGSVSTMIRRWHYGRYRATRSVRSRELLTELMPRLLDAFAGRSDPNRALARFDAFLSGLPAGVQLFSLFYSNPALLDLVAEIMGDAPRLAEWLSRNPRLLDHVLSLDFFRPSEDAEAMRRELQNALLEAADFQDVLEIARRWTNDRKFQTGVRILHGDTDGYAAGPVLSATAETAIQALWPFVEAEFAGPGGDHGQVPGGAMAVVAMGKLGGRELMPESDLDLVFVYDIPDEAEMSDGGHPLQARVYFMRLSQRIVGAIEALTGEGRLYEVDTRLRPCGAKGPTASVLEGFIGYYEEAAWTWEHLALTRARAVAGDPALMRRLDEEIHKVLVKPRDPDRLVVDVADMRARMARKHKAESRWDIKRRRGGLVDIEFIGQYLQLLHAAEHPTILSTNALTALRNLADADLLERETSEDIANALRLWHRAQTVLRLTTKDELDDESASQGPRKALVRVTGAEDFSSLVTEMDETASRIRGYFAALIDEPAERARPRVSDK